MSIASRYSPITLLTIVTRTMTPFIETIHSKEGLIEACKKGFEDYQSKRISKNDFCMFFGFTHGEAITKYYAGNYAQLLLDGGFNSGSEAYFSGGINAWKNLNNGTYTFPPLREALSDIPKEHTSPLQTIYFGSPGTGKSHKVKTFVLKGVPEYQIFRTTFHPDSDYASFVGCYKPVCHKSRPAPDSIVDYEELVIRLKAMLSEHPSNPAAGFSMFGFEYRESLIAMEQSGEHTIVKLVEDAYKANTTYDTIVRAGMQIKDESASSEVSRISYEFSPQVFTKAYCKAWKNPDKQIYLVIEEINRGNCAQIFGDLFQLLDRKDGISEYPIDADTDLRLYLDTELQKTEDGECDGSEGIMDGKLCIPANFNIIATMNTSDQSLFPMDSAFKRRWEWKYIPTIAPKNGDKQLELSIENAIEMKDGRKISAGDYEYSWKDFLTNINTRILNITHSEDKQLGYWFVKADDSSGRISISSFVSKVVFYLWNDVFKDIGPKDTNPFTIRIDGKNEIMSFNSFFEENIDGDVVENLGVLHTFLSNVGLTPEPVNKGLASNDGIDNESEDADKTIY